MLMQKRNHAFQLLFTLKQILKLALLLRKLNIIKEHFTQRNGLIKSPIFEHTRTKIKSP